MTVPAALPPSRGILSASAVMAAGTVVSRATGFLRSALIIAAIGTSLDADVFTLANTLPNALYILVAGGVFNVVLVPQLVRAMREDADGGDAYARRIVTLGVLVLAVATVVLVLAVPLLVRLIYAPAIFDPGNAGALSSAYALMRYCLPQVFFYGAFVLVSQVLNSRNVFGPVMWMPIANNIIACGVLGLYITHYGATDGSDGFTRGQELLLGLGSTAGIVVQAGLLLPFLRRAGFRYRPRLDFRHTGLGRTLRLSLWTLLLIGANQLAFNAVYRIASSSTTAAKVTGGRAAGATVYQLAFVISQVPHGIITVSVVTASMPMLARLAAEHRPERVRAELTSTVRLILSVIAPLAVALACLGLPLATVLTSYGALTGQSRLIGLTIIAFAPGMVFYATHFLMLRGFYAMEDTRTPFLIQAGLSAVNVGLAYGLVALVSSSYVSTVLALAYGSASLVGAVASVTVLSRRLGPILDGATVRYLGRLAAACGVAAAVILGSAALLMLLGLSPERTRGALVTLVVCGGLGGLAYLAAARLLRLGEVAALFRAVLRRRG